MNYKLNMIMIHLNFKVAAVADPGVEPSRRRQDPMTPDAAIPARLARTTRLATFAPRCLGPEVRYGRS